MNKRKLALVLTGLLMLALLGGCCLKHEWKDATCESPMTCAKCEKTEGEALGHSWADADCVTAKTCTVCGKTEGEALGHSWVDADCVTAKTCSVCGETEGEPLGHLAAWMPDAENFEKMTGTCSVCSRVLVEAVDWEKVAPGFVVGTWQGSKFTQDKMNFSDLKEGTVFEIRQDGTATLTMPDEVFEFTWNYKMYDIPYENLSVTALGYDFVHPDGGVSTVGVTYIFGQESNMLFLYVDDTIMVFKK